MKINWINEINSRNSEEKFFIHSENAIYFWRMLFVLGRCCSSWKRCTNCENAVYQICFHHNHRWISNKQNCVPIFSVVAVFVHSSGSTVVTRFLLIFLLILAFKWTHLFTYATHSFYRSDIVCRVLYGF